MKANKKRILLGLILCLAIVRGILYTVLIPFDRSPDESHHFHFIKAKQMQLLDADKEQIQLMTARIQLQRYYLMYPEAADGKRTLQHFENIRPKQPPPSRKLYYLLAAWLLRIVPFGSIVAEIYAIRLVSVLCGVSIVFISFAASRELFPDNDFMQFGVPAFISFIPQFSAMSAVVTNDKLMEVCTALMFWALIRLCKFGLTPKTLLSYLLWMGLALLGKRTAVFTIPFFLFVLFVYYWKSAIGWRMHLLIGTIVIGGALVFYGALEWIAPFDDFVDEYMLSVSSSKTAHFLLFDMYSKEYLKFFTKFFALIYISFWGLFDYMAIHIHHFWYLLLGGWQFLAGCGLVKSVWRIKRKQMPWEPWKAKALYLLGASIFFLLAVVVFRSIVARPDVPFLAQGRRLFSTLLPIGILTVFGIEQLFPPKFRASAGIVGLIALIMMDGACLFNTLMLNYHFSTLF